MIAVACFKEARLQNGGLSADKVGFEFFALDHGLQRGIRAGAKSPGPEGMQNPAFHGRLGARVALLQSPIPPAAEGR